MAMNGAEGGDEKVKAAMSNAVNYNMKKAYKISATFIPETADFPIQDPNTFCSAFRQQLLQLQEHLEDWSLNIIKLEDLELGFTDTDAKSKNNTIEKNDSGANKQGNEKKKILDRRATSMWPGGTEHASMVNDKRLQRTLPTLWKQIDRKSVV